MTPGTKNDIKNWAWFLGALAVAGAVGFGGGRWTAPTKVTEVTKTAEHNYDGQFAQLSSQVKQLSTQLTEATARLDKKNDVVHSRLEEHRPDGTVLISDKTEDKSTSSATSTTKTESTTSFQLDMATILAAIKESSKTTEHTKIVESLKAPEWLVGVGFGFNVPSIMEGDDVQYPPSLIPGIPDYLVLEVSVEKHLLWGVYGGIAGSSRGDLLLKFSKAFK